ncbi:rRNA maturation RNase YbeY [Sphingomonas rhizophila]|uniref:Endoribonuclease YbeY n=1 Tax=Sphingomonas rhizophila TaxID=2071607 RepID=A0A7G9SE61_9SPHN|nr:rRNA maturation RNase YbeY [Sphingomonas rhizophila]QNN66136.1 rRNA maturation RNase YbeY [Sphingomonas rhizophila]
MLDIAIDADPEWDSSDWGALARSAAEAAIAESAFPQLGRGAREVELSIRLTSDEEVRALNAEWRGKDKPTNVLSFPMSEPDELADTAGEGPELMLGDIILARGVCLAEAAEKSIPVEKHAAHLMVHGTLHLLGYDHHDDAEAEDMEAREVRALARLGIEDPYGDRC